MITEIAGTDGTLFNVNIESLQMSLFVQFESFGDCMTGWYATSKAYYGAGFLDAPSMAGMLFTFTWTHSTYGNYPLCISMSGGDMNLMGGDVSGLSMSLNSKGGLTQSAIDNCYSQYSDWYDQDQCICTASGIYSAAECASQFDMRRE